MLNVECSRLNEQKLFLKNKTL